MAHILAELAASDTALRRSADDAERRWRRARRSANVLGHLFDAATCARHEGRDGRGITQAAVGAFYRFAPLVTEWIEEEAGRCPEALAQAVDALAAAVADYVWDGPGDARDGAVRTAWSQLGDAFEAFFGLDLLELIERLEAETVIA